MQVKSPTKIVACIPGVKFSGNFLDNWSIFLTKCLKSGINLSMFRRYSPNIYYSRNMCLGGDIRRGTSQKPFQGEDYDYILFIDSDILFSFEQLQLLLDSNLDIVSGLYPIDSKQFSAVLKADDEYFKQNGRFEFITAQDILKQENPFPVVYCGLGFTLIKKGVFEQMIYPWFRPLSFNIGDEITDFTTEDVAFCFLAKEHNLQVFVHPKVIVGHEKSVILH